MDTADILNDHEILNQVSIVVKKLNKKIEDLKTALETHEYECHDIKSERMYSKGYTSKYIKEIRK